MSFTSEEHGIKYPVSHAAVERSVIGEGKIALIVVAQLVADLGDDDGKLWHLCCVLPLC